MSNYGVLLIVSFALLSFTSLMLGQRLRCCPNVEPAKGEQAVFAGYVLVVVCLVLWFCSLLYSDLTHDLRDFYATGRLLKTSLLVDVAPLDKRYICSLIDMTVSSDYWHEMK